MLDLGRAIRRTSATSTARIPSTRALSTSQNGSSLKPVDLNATATPPGADSSHSPKHMIFCHGLMGSSSNWRSTASAIQKRYPVTTHLLDARNHGASPHTSEMSFQLMAEDLHRYIEKNNLGRSILLGHSMGGRTAMTFASRYPSLIEKLILVDVSPITYGTEHFEYHLGLMRHLKQLDLDSIHSRADAEKQLSEHVSNPMTRGFLLQNLVNDTENPGRYKWRLNIDVVSNTLLDWIDSPDTRRFDGPTLFVAGGNSNRVKPSEYDQIKAIYPKCEISTVTGAGHDVHFEKPKEFVDLVVPFLEK